ncbi:hypothetical protein ACFFNX_36410, partial [Actinoallomurus acaciae]
MRIRPITPPLLIDEIADRVASAGTPWVRVAVDGAPPARPDRLADALATKRLILVLDNCEHLLDAAATLAD